MKEIPWMAVLTLRELTGIQMPMVGVVDESSRLYLHSGLAIGLTYYEKDLLPVADGYKRTFYYASKQFPMGPVFTHLDTELPKC